MSRLFAYRTTGKTPRPDANWLVVFSPHDTLALADISDLLAEDVGTNLQPDAVVFLVRENIAGSIALTLGELGPEDWRVPLGTTSVVVVGFTRTGALGNVHLVSGPNINIDVASFAALKNRGLCELFHLRDGLIQPSETTHFVHPSGKHSKGFIRTANLLMLGSEVMFVAMTILDRLEPDLAYICVDTSSIASIAHAAVQLRHLFGPGFAPPTVNSFSSWPGINGGYPFSQAKKTLALISASTSGNMARDLVKRKGLLPNRVLILFGLIDNSSDVNVLCNLVADPRYEGMLELVTKEYREGDCLMCHSGSTAVRFVGDQFLADAINHTSVMILGGDITGKSKAFFGRYRCRGALGMRQGNKFGTAVDTYHVDVEKLTGSAFDDRVKSACERYLAASTKLIAHADDDASTKLAEQISKQFAPLNAGKAIPGSELGKLGANSVEGSVFVIAGCVGSGACLQSISRGLRDPAGDRPRTYLVGVAKHAHHPRHSSLKGDLVYSSTDHKHVVVILEELTLPERQGVSAWEAELGILNELIEPDPNATLHPAALDALTDRITAINGLAKRVDDYFWDAADGSPLTLRKTFAFWDGSYEASDVSHGDILLTIACVLENLRDGPSPRLHRTAFHHGFISPATFGRYNDGVIQAAFLRSALPGELDYSGDEDGSREMSRILKRIFMEWEGARGEAAIEFLISLMCCRMKLKALDLLHCLEALDGVTHPVLALFRDRCAALAI